MHTLAILIRAKMLCSLTWLPTKKGIQYQSTKMYELLSLHYGTKNCNRRNNAIFNILMSSQDIGPVKYDRIPRALDPKPLQNAHLCDVISGIHQQTEGGHNAISARIWKSLSYSPSWLSKTHTSALQSSHFLIGWPLVKDIQYYWGFPFQLYPHNDVKFASFKRLGDLPTFLVTFNLPTIALLGWPSPLLLWELTYMESKSTI